MNAADVFDEQVVALASRSGRMAQCFMVMGLPVACHLGEMQTESGSWIVQLSPMRPFVYDFGEVSVEGESGKGIYPMFLASTRFLSVLERELPGWFTLTQDTLDLE